MDISPVHVLLVDDDREYYLLLVELLSFARTPFAVSLADSVQAARDMLAAHEYDLLLVDYRLGDGNGVEVMVHATSIGFTAPMIMLTGIDSEEAEIAAMHAGAADYISKGRLDIRMLERTVLYALERRKMTEALRLSEERLRTVVGSAPVLLFSTDTDGVLTLADGLGLASLGLTAAEMIGRSGYELYPHIPAIERNIRRALAGETFTEIIDFGPVVLDTRYSPTWDARGNVIGMVGVGTDITARMRSEQALRQSEEHFRRLIENAGDIIAVIEEDGAVRYQSPAVQRILGYSLAERIGRPVFELIHPDDLETAHATFAELLAEPGSSRRVMIRYRRSDGSWIWLETTGTNQLADPALRGIVINARDISERIQAEQERAAAVKALGDSEENYRVVAETASDAIVTIDEEGTILFVNNGAARIFGYSPSEMIGASITMLVPRIIRELHQPGIAGYLATGVRHLPQEMVELTALHASGREIPIEVSVADYLRDGRRLFTCIARDISERRRLEQERERLLHLVEEDRRKLDDLVNGLPGIVWETWLDPARARGENFVSPYVQTMLGYHPEEWIEHPSLWLDVIHPDDRSRIITAAADDRATDDRATDDRATDDRATGDRASDRSMTQLMHRMIARDGRVIWVEARLMIGRDEIGRPTVLRGIALDVTDRRNAEEALRASEERFRITIDNSPIVVFTQDRDLRYTWIRNAELIYRTPEVIGRRDEDLFDAAGAAELARGKRAIMESGVGTRSEVKLVRDGSTYHFDLVMEPLRDEQGEVTGIACVAIDITERKKATEGATLFRTLIDQSNDAFFLTEPDTGRFIDVNETACAELGYTREEMLELGVLDVLHDPDRTFDWHEHRGELRAGDARTFDSTHRRKDGSTFPVEVIVKTVTVDGREYMLATARDMTERRRAAEDLVLFRNLIDQSSDAIFVIDPESARILDANQAAWTGLGYRREELLSMTTLQISLSFPDAATWSGHVETLRASGWENREGEHVRADGTVFPVEVTVTRVVIDQHEFIVAVARDVTERRRSEQAVRRSQEFFQRFMDNIPAFAFMKDASGRYVYCNHQLAGLLGLSPEEVIGRTDEELSPWEVARRTRESDEMVRSLGRPLGFTERVAGDDGEIFLHMVKFPMLDAEGEPMLAGIAVDATERIRAEQRLEQSQARFLAFVDNSPVMFYLKDEAGRYIVANRHFSSMLGMETAEVIGKTDADLWDLEVAAAFAESDRQLRAIGLPIESQERVVTGGVEHYWFSIRFLVPGESGRMLIGGTAVEITERVRAEASLRQSEERLQLVTRATNDAIWDWNLLDDSIWWNQNVHTLFGYSPDQMTSMVDFWYQHLHQDDRERVVQRLRQAIASGLPFWTDDYRFRRGDGTYAYVFDRGYVLHQDGKPVRMIGAMADISERKNVEEALRDSETKFRRIVETAQEGILVTDERGIITFVNARMAEILGYAVEEMMHTLYADYMDEEGRQLARQKADRRREGIAEQYDFKFVRKDGTPVWTIVSANPVFGKEGSIVGSLGMVTDITDRKRAEEALREAHDELEVRVQERTAEIVEMMARLAASHRMQKRFVADASHDLRTPLTVVQAEIDLLLARESNPEETRRSLLRVSAEAKRLNSLANDLLLLATLDANSGEIDLKSVQRLDELLLESVANLSTLAQEKHLAWSIRIDEPIELRCDPSSIDRAITNVLENAIKYSPESSVITVALERREAVARIVVADNGTGIPADDLPKVFDRFYRSDHTRSTPGTGLGLAIAKAVVETHNGSITIESATNVGTTLYITLPCIND